MNHSRPRSALALLLLAVSASTAHSQPQLPEWRLSPAPLLTVEDNGTPATEFHRIAGAWRLPNGNVVVANGSTSELRVFDSKGALTETFGRRGKGPGEFELMSIIDVAADTAMIYDFSTRRVTSILFGAKARLLATVNMMPSGANSGFEVSGRLSDGRWVATMGMGQPGGWDAPKGVHRVKGTVGLVARDGTGAVEPVAEVLSIASLTYTPSSDKTRWRTGPAAFSPWYVGRVSGGALWFGESGSDSLVRLDAKGVRRKVMLPLPAVALNQRAIAAARDAELESQRQFGSSDFTTFKFSAENLPARLPYYSGLLAGANGELWVQEYSVDPAAGSHFLVLDAQGKPIGRVATLPSFRATHAGRDFVVGITRDADGVEGVKVLRLERR